MKKLLPIVPWLFVAMFAAEIIAVMAPKKDGVFHTREFARLPVLMNGRIQPIDSVARNSLLQIRSTGDLPLEIVPSWKFWHHPRKLKPTEWLLELMTRPEVADTRPVFLIHHADLLGELKLQDRGVEKSGLRYYTFNELRPHLSEIGQQSGNASQVKEEQRTTFQKQVLKLANAVMLYNRLKNTIQPEGVRDWAGELEEFRRDVPAARTAARASQAGLEFDKSALSRIAEPIQHFQVMADYGQVMVIPPTDPQHHRDAWQTAGNSLMDSARSDDFHPAVLAYARMATAYAQDRPEEFNQALEQYRSWLTPSFSHELRKGRAEFFYNDVKAFLHATIMYIFALVLALLGLLTFGLGQTVFSVLRKSAMYVIILALLLHTFALIFRMVLEGRPPVTNLYSSAIFIGWAVVILGLILERVFPVCIGCVVAGLSGFITLLIAHNLALGGDTMEMLRAVLDTNFWLSTHVVTVTLGYASTFAAGTLAVLYVLIGVFTPMLQEKLPGNPGQNKVPSRATASLSLGKAFGKMVYGIVCFATLFSFVGTVLGGIWADQSWGRFWGWDPKENGALMIVIWNALILHARWGGLVRERGLMNLAIFGNIVTSFSWFGVNMLGIGLHSYGFMDAAFKWLIEFIALMVALIVVGLLPLRLWRSFRGQVSVQKPGDLPANTAPAT